MLLPVSKYLWLESNTEHGPFIGEVLHICFMSLNWTTATYYILASHADKLMNHLQSVQDAAAVRLVTFAWQFYHMTSVLRQMHWFCEDNDPSITLRYLTISKCAKRAIVDNLSMV